MGLLDHLWDDTVAGPPPDSGLGKLRKHKTFSFGSPSVKERSSDAGMARSCSDDSTHEVPKVTRSIMIVKPPDYGNGNNGLPPASPAGSTPPASPAGSTPPVSPFSGSQQWGDLEEGLHRMHTGRELKLSEQGTAPAFLTTCDI